MDAVITNKLKYFSGGVDIVFGRSDFHNLIAVTSRMYAAVIRPRNKINMSAKRVSEELFLEHMECMPFHVSEIFDDIDDIYWGNNYLVI